MKKFQKLLAAAVAGSLLSTSALGVAAVGRKDVFNAKYYADTYADLKAAFGYNEEALYKHYLTYGTKEGRKMTPVLDIVKYRETYKDLDKAFGDNWDAYVQHYFTFGMKEKRVSGGTFDPVAYAEAYSDIKKAFGNNYKAIINHYLTYGIKEGRTAGVTIVTAPASGGGSSDDDDAPVKTEPKPQGPTLAEKVTEALAAPELSGTVTSGNAAAAADRLLNFEKDVRKGLMNDATGLAKVKEVDDSITGRTIANAEITAVNSQFNSANATDFTVVGAKLSLADSQTAKLKLTAASNPETTSAALVLSDGATNVQVMNISLVDNTSGQPVELKFPVQVTMPVPKDVNEGALMVWHYKDGGPVDPISPTVDNGKMTFVVDSFSKFAIGNAITAANLQKAISKAKDGDTIKLVRSIDLGTVALTIDKNVTLDLGGGELKSAPTGPMIQMEASKKLTVQNGTITQSAGTKAVAMEDSSEFTLADTATINYTGTSNQYFAVVMNAKKGSATKITKAKAVIAGTINAPHGLATNGNLAHDDTDSNLCQIEVSGTINAAYNCLYLAGPSVTTLKSGAKLIGERVGVEIRAGKLTVESGAEITSKAKDLTTATTKADLGKGAVNWGGVPVAVMQHLNEQSVRQPITVTINSGAKLNTASGTYLYVSDAWVTTYSNAKNVNVTVATGIVGAGENAVIVTSNAAMDTVEENTQYVPCKVKIGSDYVAIAKETRLPQE